MFSNLTQVVHKLLDCSSVLGSEGHSNLAVVQNLDEMHQIEAQGVVINQIVYVQVSVVKVLQNFTLGCFA